MNAPANAQPRDLRALISGDAMKKQFAMALPKVMPIDSFIRSILTSIGKTPALAECAQDTIFAGCMTAASLGLPLDPALGRAYLIPFRDNKRGCMVAQFVVGYKGYVDLFYRSGMAAGIQAEAVYTGDHFLYQLGLEPKLEHIPSEQEDRGTLRYAYAVASLQNGGKVWKVLNRAQVMKSKNFSRGSSAAFSPWQTNEAEMWAKTAIRALSDLLPLSPELQQAVSTIDASERDFANSLDVSGQATVRTDEAAAIKDAQPDAPAGDLKPSQRVNAEIAKATQAGVKPDTLKKVLAKVLGDNGTVSQATEEQAASLVESIKLEVRQIMEPA